MLLRSAQRGRMSSRERAHVPTRLYPSLCVHVRV
jgi:hypothetical protein